MTKEQLEKHKIAAGKLILIKDNVLVFVKENLGKISEYDVHMFIASEFKRQGMVTQKKYPTQIVASGPNTSFVHYYPKTKGSRIIEKNNLVLIDIWAKLNEKDAPFADITWMGYTGKNIPKGTEKIFNLVARARNEVINFIKISLKDKRLPTSLEIEKSARNYFEKFGVEKFFKHGVGHSLGITQDHGTYFRFSKKTKSKLKINVPFTIEPGIYFKNEFGVRSEINCYIDKNYTFIPTTTIQEEIIKI